MQATDVGNSLRFESRVQYGAELPMAAEARVKHEPMLFSASIGFARDKGSALTRAFLQSLPPEWLEGHVVIDSRTHMLMPGWYPCIPGWHLDDVPRTRDDGQPDHANPKYRAEHVMAIWGSASVTSFLTGDVDLTEPPSGDPTYAVWHAILEDRIRRGELQEHHALTQRLIFFNWQTFHKGNPATKAGWRFFIRASRNTERPILNEKAGASAGVSPCRQCWLGSGDGWIGEDVATRVDRFPVLTAWGSDAGIMVVNAEANMSNETAESATAVVREEPRTSKESPRRSP